ncbi:hypothetical protein F5Y04DRAFT_61351 [Hypomontagnella monticulosa]|nr:hypothetical protein F5Y04DRAFT_61351 [Hypomontagnella monticulosa]
MAKERADKPRKERAEKSEKKVSQDKVKKHKKDKKSRRAESPGASDNEAEEVKAISAAAEESVSQPSVTDPASDTKSRNEEKADKTEKKKSKKSKKASIEAAIAEGASNDIQLPVRPASKGSEADDSAPLFAIDVEPSRVDPKTLPVKAAPEAMDVDRAGNEGEEQHSLKPPSGLNRQVRRRIKLIERQREKIQKDLGVAVGSSERADEVQAQLDKWVEKYDMKASIRDEKKRVRKAKEAARLRNKRGKLLTGERLKEAKKKIQKAQKGANKVRRGGLSAPREA